MGKARDARAQKVWIGLRSVLFDLEDRRHEVAQTLDLSFVRTKALRHLVAEPLSMRTLAHELATDAPYTTIVVDDLERRGLVTRTVNPADRRTKIVTITPDGTDVAHKAQAILDRPPKALLKLKGKDLATLERIVSELLGD